MKYCPDCKTNKIEADYYKNMTRYDNLCSHCKACTIKRAAARRLAVKNGAKVTAGRWEETEADHQDMPPRVCGGCGSNEERLLSPPGRLESIAGAWWHIPCYNESTPESKEAATIKMQELWDNIAEKWEHRANRHCNGGPGGTEHAAKRLKELGPEKYARYKAKVKKDTAKQMLKRSRIRNAQTGR